MYSNLTLYYLNQIGIIPWVKKQSSLNNKPELSEYSAPKLIILKNNTLNDKAEALFKKMLGYLNLNESDLLVSDSLSPALVLDEQSPKAILLLGMELETLTSRTNLSCPVLSGVSPDVLLKKPSEKRAVFQVLHSIKVLINSN